MHLYRVEDTYSRPGGMISYVDSGMSNLRNNFRRREDSIFYPGNSAASFTRRRGLSQCYLCNSFAAKIQEYLVLLHAAASRLRCYGNLGFPPILTLVTRLLVIVSKARRREDFGCYMSNNLAAGLGSPLLMLRCPSLVIGLSSNSPRHEMNVRFAC